MPPFDREFFAVERLEMDAINLFDLVARLDERSPGFAAIADARAAFAIDGVFAPDWSASLAGVNEVILLPRVGGG